MSWRRLVAGDEAVVMVTWRNCRSRIRGYLAIHDVSFGGLSLGQFINGRIFNLSFFIVYLFYKKTCKKVVKLGIF
jgi:hypothetical protein